MINLFIFYANSLLDLVPKENLTQWLKYLRNELPAIAFKASTQMQSTKLGRGRNKFLKSSQPEIQTSNCLGADTLMTLLGNYARNKGIKTAIRVGVVGKFRFGSIARIGLVSYVLFISI